MQAIHDTFVVDWALAPPPTSQPDVVLEWEQRHDDAVVRVAGAVDRHTIQKLKDILDHLLERSPMVTVEFGELDHVGPEILGVLVWAMRRASSVGRDVVGRIPDGSGTRVLRVVGLTEELTFTLEPAAGAAG